MARGPLRDYGITIVTAVVVALLIRAFVIEAYRIPSAAMKPTLEAGDTIFVSKLAYGFHGRKSLPKRGDVIVFSPPPVAGEPGRDYIKRVIGLPGDTVEMKSGRLKLNGHPLEVEKSLGAPCGHEALLEGPTFEYCLEPPLLEDFGPAKVPEGSLFVVGDFRGQGASDRHENRFEAPHPKSWGIVPADSVRGKALWIWLSVDRGSGGSFPQIRFNRMLRRVE